MKKIFSSQNSMIIHHMKNLLEVEGIRAIVRNENLSVALGSLPATECWVELWILDESREHEARDIIRKESDAEEQAIKWPWRCPYCGERIDGQFTDCWQCGEPNPEYKNRDEY